ncbi:MAG: YihA family ribosome biogenesis GTP-binding protein [Oscillospiraceae bacterium]|nr:YihA family ribosome biogenesis GTP-binding protein [Oscillospiraceae bacterium]
MNFNQAEFLASYGLASQLPPSQGMEIAFAGRSNVGKSSAINRIFQRKSLARVSSVPGKTATINFYGVGEVRFVDLPGYGYAKAAKSEQLRWSELIEGYFAQDRSLRLVILLVDMRHPASPLDVQMAEFLLARELPFLVLLTKSDKLNKTETARRMEDIRRELPGGEDLTILPFSSQTGAGADEFRGILQSLCGV